jgi:hypothetical protein
MFAIGIAIVCKHPQPGVRAVIIGLLLDAVFTKNNIKMLGHIYAA